MVEFFIFDILKSQNCIISMMFLFLWKTQIWQKSIYYVIYSYYWREKRQWLVISLFLQAYINISIVRKDCCSEAVSYFTVVTFVNFTSKFCSPGFGLKTTMCTAYIYFVLYWLYWWEPPKNIKSHYCCLNDENSQSFIGCKQSSYTVYKWWGYSGACATVIWHQS